MRSGSKRIFSLEIWVSVFEKTNFGQSGTNLPSLSSAIFDGGRYNFCDESSVVQPKTI